MSNDKNEVTGTLNPIGYKIEFKDVDRILEPKNSQDESEREIVASFFRATPTSPDRLTRELLIRYAKACEVMSNMSFSSANEDIWNKLIATLAGAKRCYCYGENLACIELCALHGEMLANFLCIINKEVLSSMAVVEKLPNDVKGSVKKHLRKGDFYDKLNQQHRIAWLEAGSIILNHSKDLLDVHEIRKNYFHRWDQPHTDIDRDALSSLVKISNVASQHLELLYNNSNITKVRAYMGTHFPSNKNDTKKD